MARCNEYSLLLLAGGKSSRMGSPKASLPLAGKPFWAHMVEKAKLLGLSRIYISGSDPLCPDIQTVPDRYPDRGPLGGIHAGLLKIHTPYCLVLPVDAPLLNPEIPEKLMAYHETSADKNKVLIWEHGDRQEPLIAIYPAAMAQSIEELIRLQSAPVFRALDRWGYDRLRLETDENQILNVNTPDLYQKITELP